MIKAEIEDGRYSHMSRERMSAETAGGAKTPASSHIAATSGIDRGAADISFNPTNRFKEEVAE